MNTSAIIETSSLDELLRHGFLYLEDECIGNKIQEVDDQKLSNQLSSWDSFADVVLRHPAFRQLLDPFLQHSNPQQCHTFGAEPGQIFCFWPQPEQSHRLAVVMWSAGTEITFLDGSHKGKVTTAFASNGLFEASRYIKGYDSVSVRLEKGGITVQDVRSLFERKSGFMIAYGMNLQPGDMLHPQQTRT